MYIYVDVTLFSLCMYGKLQSMNNCDSLYEQLHCMHN